MRNVADRYVLEYIDAEEALGINYEKANLRRLADDPSGSVAVTSFLDLQEAYELLNRHRELLPEELGIEMRRNTALLNQLVPIRNRVMHGRPLQPGDPENATLACSAFTTRYWSTVKETLDHLVNDPSWEPAFQRQAKHSERILHNLPLPEYDETGLIGRSNYCKTISGYLMRRREPIITITGEGGIGKTALALEVANNILDNPESPYECILWVSLKTERLTTSGIVTIADAVEDITGAATVLGRAVVDDFKGSISELAEMLDGIETLLVIDNLETVDGSEVVTLYETLPTTVSYLFTSRIGVGQFERRVDLGPLPNKDADLLFRNFAKSRGADRLAQLSGPTVREVVARLRNSPLAIRWYILAVSSGERPDLALADQSTLLDFCVRSVYNAMNAKPQLILGVLFALDRSVSFDELAILTDLTVDELRRAVQALLNGSMVIHETDSQSELLTRIRLTEAARNFLRKVQPPQNATIEEILARERNFRKSDEHRRADREARELAPNTVRTRNDNDRPTAHLLRLALLASRESTIQRAIELTSRARALNPEFWEVDRVEGFLLSSAGQVEQATAMYRNALLKADAEGVAVVSYYFAGHLARKAHAVEPAIEFARKAHEYFGTAETAQQLGTFLTWNREFDEGQGYLITALEDAHGKLYLITLTSLIESWYRWSEELLKVDRRPLEAVHKAYTGFNLGAKQVETGTYDVRLAEAMLSCVLALVRASTSIGVDTDQFREQLIALFRVLDRYKTLFERTRSWRQVPGVMGFLLRSRVDERVKGVCLRIVSPDPFQETDKVVARGVHEEGLIRAWRGTFGFISHPDYPSGVFFPASALEGISRRGEELNLMGRMVNFTAEPDVKGSPRANWVKLLEHESPA